MAVPFKRGSQLLALFALVLPVTALVARADEIRLKDGKKLYGVIVAYEDNMFKIKTDYGFVLVEKDKISTIIPSTPASAKPESQPAAKKDPAPANPAPKTQPAVAAEKTTQPPTTNASTRSVDPPLVRQKPAAKITNAPVKPEIPASTAKSTVAPTIKPSVGSPATALTSTVAAPAPPKEPEVPSNREDIQGNLYTNYTRGFRMYKAPSWKLIDDARNALPNAIVAMGTFNESTLLVVGQEKTKQTLDATASSVEKRLHEVYENYRLISQKKAAVNGLPALEYHYRGLADGHDWSGTLVVVARGSEIFTVLGMTYADTDLIQIQENVIARSIASMDFNVH